jgi:transcription initiation factor TFIIIB Brf1 subunit/transcription initiation factor TFIIB
VTLLEVCCTHFPTEIEGENVCRECGAVLGYSEVQSVNSWQTHDISFFNNNNMNWLIFRVANNLSLPSYATQTIIHTSIKLNKAGITKKKAIFFATVYACRVHKIPRLLADIFYELEKSAGTINIKTEFALLKSLNKIAKKLTRHDVSIFAPNKEYYLQAYLAKIQDVIVRETDQKYFDLVRTRSIKNLYLEKTDPSTAAKNAILSCTTKILQAKIKPLME